MAKILLVEDNPEILEDMTAMLAVDRHEIMTASNANEALSQIVGQKFDLLILDWELPDATGVDICSLYREKGGQAPVIMVTGRVGVDDKEEGLNAGADDYLCKPVEPRELRARVKALLRRTSDRAGVVRQKEVFPDVGSTVGNYVLLKKIAEGGMGIVFQAKHQSLEKGLLALKVLKIEHCEMDDLQRFDQEAKIMSRLNHPNVAQVFDHGQSGSYPYLVMEYIEGTNLFKILQEGQILPIERAMPIFIQICDAIQHLHEHGIVHRDLKPGNIMLTNDCNADKIKVIDMGIVKQLPTETEEAMRLTQTGQVFGSPCYMSPEQGLGKKVDHRSDVYSMGVLMYETLTGQVPFHANTFTQVILMHCHSAVKPFKETNPACEVPEHVALVILKCLEKEPDKRPQSLKEVRDALSSTPVNASAPAQDSSSSAHSEGQIGLAARLRQAIENMPLLKKNKRE